MTRRALLMATVAGLLLAAGAPKKNAPAAPIKEERYDKDRYAKVELKGVLTLEPSMQGSVAVVSMGLDGLRLELDLSRQPPLQGEALRKLTRETVVVKGTLIGPPGKEMKLRVLVLSLRVVGNP